MVVFIMENRKTVFVTGATSGVGYALSKRLLKEGYEVLATGRSLEVLTELQKAGASIHLADLTQVADRKKLIGFVGTPDIVVFSAGIGTFEFAHALDDDALDQMMAINVIAPIALTKDLLPNLMKRKEGHLIYIGSQAGKVATPKASTYAATKHALIGYTNALRMEVKQYNIKVTTINPGPIDTPFLDLADDTGNYRGSLSKHLLSVDKVVDAIMHSIHKPVREVNLPWYMGITSKLYALAPAFTERVGHRFFYKK